MNKMILTTLKKIVPVTVKVRIYGFLNWIKMVRKINRAEEIGVKFVSPNYLFKDVFGKNSVIVDVGCGYDADFSMFMIKKYGLRAIGIDPTHKHKEPLAHLSKKTGGLFQHKALAVSAFDGKISFNESVDNVSGSILAEHKNVKNKGVRKYEVESVSLAKLPEKLNLPRIEYIKLDLEGAEYDLLQNIEVKDLEKYDQIFVEFHHHCLPQYTKDDTLDRVRIIEALGFTVFTLDNHNFLFYP